MAQPVSPTRTAVAGASLIRPRVPGLTEPEDAETGVLLDPADPARESQGRVAQPDPIAAQLEHVGTGQPQPLVTRCDEVRTAAVAEGGPTFTTGQPVPVPEPR